VAGGRGGRLGPFAHGRSHIDSRSKPLIVQHSFGTLGAGGPIGALERVLESGLADSYDFARMHQARAQGGLDISRIRKWVSWLRDVRPDVVHVRGLGNEGFHGALAARLAGCPRVLVSVHGTVRDLTVPRTFKHEVIVRGLEPSTLRLATHITTVCEFAARRDFVARHRDKFVGPIVNGVDLPKSPVTDRRTLRRMLGMAEDRLVVLSVGRLSLEKGHRSLAAAIHQLPPRVAEQVQLVVVGGGPDEPEIRHLYAGVKADVLFVGQRLDVPRFLEAADIFAFPSLHENLSNALLEAMAHGLPAIASRVGGNIEVVERGGGILVARDDDDALAEAIIRLVTSDSMRQAMGSAARRTVADNYSTGHMCESLDQVYRQVLERNLAR
jgi:glycosyltransferase involved in cell wall biosynthesis